MNESSPVAFSLSLYDIYDRMDVLRQAGRFDLCGLWLARVDLSLLDEQHTLAFLMSTVDYKDLIPGRAVFAARAQEHLASLGRTMWTDIEEKLAVDADLKRDLDAIELELSAATDPFVYREIAGRRRVLFKRLFRDVNFTSGIPSDDDITNLIDSARGLK